MADPTTDSAKYTLMDFPKVENFKQEEFTCKCGCGAAAMKPSFIKRLDEARAWAGTPFKVRSGFRCRQHNLDVGGSDTSSHPRGCAADIEAKTSYERFLIIRGCLTVGLYRIGIGKDFIHIDKDMKKPDQLLWLYPLNRKKRS